MSSFKLYVNDGGTPSLIPMGDDAITVDTSLSETSVNPVRNAVIKAALDTKASDSAVVHKTGNETIAGTKTFSSALTVNASPMVMSSKMSGVGIADTTRTSNKYIRVVSVVDKDNKRFFDIESVAKTDGSRLLQMIARNKADTGYILGPALCETKNGLAYSTATATPATPVDSNTIVTTGWADKRYRALSKVEADIDTSTDIGANDTRAVPAYIVGTATLNVYVNGIRAKRGSTFQEVGTAGTTSTTIKFLTAIPSGSDVEAVVG